VQSLATDHVLTMTRIHDMTLDSQTIIPSLQETADISFSLHSPPPPVIDLKLQFLLGCRACTHVWGMWGVKLPSDCCESAAFCEGAGFETMCYDYLILVESLHMLSEADGVVSA
jgi:hypothetical protein